MSISLDALPESALGMGRLGITEQSIVRDTLDLLGDKEKQILYLYFFKDMSQEDIAKRIDVPIGTVKSRLHYAKEKFKKHYPKSKTSKGDIVMRKLPEYLPEYKIEKSDLAPFEVKCEELMGLCIIPRLNEKITWASYAVPSRKMDDFTVVSVNGKAEVHGIEGVEILSKEHNCKSNKDTERYFVAQLTDTHCRYLAESHVENGIRKINYYSYMSKAGYMAAKQTIESGTTNYLHDVEYAAMQAMKEDVKKAIKVFSGM